MNLFGPGPFFVVRILIVVSTSLWCLLCFNYLCNFGLILISYMLLKTHPFLSDFSTTLNMDFKAFPHAFLNFTGFCSNSSIFMSNFINLSFLSSFD